MISCVDLPPNKATKSAEEAEENVRRIVETNLDICREDFDYELDKVHRLPIIKVMQKKKKKKKKKPRNIICKFRTHRFREYFYAKKKDILNITNKKVNFHVSLTKCRLDLLH